MSDSDREMFVKFRDCLEYFAGKCPSDFVPEINECKGDCARCWYNALDEYLNDDIKK